MVEQRLPEEWPAGVHPFWAEDFPQSAAEWLFGLLPGDYRLHGVLRRYPAALSALALRHVRTQLEAAREGYRSTPAELDGLLPPAALDQVRGVYRTEGTRLAATLRAVEAVDRALRGLPAGTGVR
ncbi:hypothetical protein [Thermobifida cellulosilytica]|uniref:Uncharacterized protein n=1 Tax=Thermobifida cellulosilytica TB100 TaxID=665004 RepID=A0A147KDV6_THECS|nr:hypothetical protein [Thermobifida cellulosilytica]KUP95429.1 hypothetical protein AC529_17865 [Thermobifida cellulosilytica TB100]